jgi:hypothetical protein
MLKKGDIVSVSSRKGFDQQGNPFIETLDRCEVEEYNGGKLTVSYRVIGKSENCKDQVEIHTMTFNVNSPDFVGMSPKKK